MFRLDGVNQSAMAIRAHLQNNVYNEVQNVGTSYKTIDENLTDSIKHRELGFFSQEILGRICAVQIACIALDAAITQATRGTILLASGIVTLNCDLIFEGIRDYISIIVGTVALAILAVVCVISPQSAEEFGRFILRNDLCTKGFYKDQIWGKCIAECLFRVASIPLSAIRSALRIPVFILDLDLPRTLGSVYCTVREPLANIVRLFNEFTDKELAIARFVHFSYVQPHSYLAEDVKTLLDWTDCCSDSDPLLSS